MAATCDQQTDDWEPSPPENSQTHSPVKTTHAVGMRIRSDAGIVFLLVYCRAAARSKCPYADWPVRGVAFAVREYKSGAPGTCARSKRWDRRDARGATRSRGELRVSQPDSGIAPESFFVDSRKAATDIPVSTVMGSLQVFF